MTVCLFSARKRGQPKAREVPTCSTAAPELVSISLICSLTALVMIVYPCYVRKRGLPEAVSWVCQVPPPSRQHAETANQGEARLTGSYLWLIRTGTGTGMFSWLYPPPHISKYNQKLAAEGDDQLAEPTLPILFKSVMFEYWVSQNYKQLKIYFPKNHSYSFNFLREN